MKVLYVTNSVGMGGASVALINVLEHLTKYNITPLVTCPVVGTFSKKLEEMNIPFIAIFIFVFALDIETTYCL